MLVCYILSYVQFLGEKMDSGMFRLMVTFIRVLYKFYSYTLTVVFPWNDKIKRNSQSYRRSVSAKC